MTPLSPAYGPKAGKRRDAFLVFALFCYVISSGIVPAGFMAAPLDSGTAFHLCPGDARSALIIDALEQGVGHHHHHHVQDSESTPGVDVDCGFAGSGNALVFASANPDLTEPQNLPPGLFFRSSARYTFAWARPPARSPPA